MSETRKPQAARNAGQPIELMTYYLMLRAYGDCVISFGLLGQLARTTDVRILGTKACQRVAQALSFQRYPIDYVLDDVAAFFDVRYAGVRRALSDLGSVRRHLAARLRPGDRVCLEHADWRNRLLMPRGVDATLLEPRHGQSAYEDRRAMLAGAFATPLATPPARRPGKPVRRIVVNPAARLEHKQLPHAILANLAAYAARRGVELVLLDADARHGALAPRIHHYAAGFDLDRDLEHLRSADFYVGADSFFLHLAYYFGLPMLAIAPTPEFHFEPPGLREANGIATIRAASDAMRLEQALDAALQPA